MRLERFAVISLAALTLGLNANGAEQSGWASEDSRLGLLNQASLLRGKKVADRKEKALGEIQDVLVDLSSGQALLVLVAADSHGDVTLVPALSFTRTSMNKLLLLNCEREVFRTAPKLARADLNLASAPGLIESAFRQFDQKLSEPPPEKGICPVSRLLGLPVVSKTNEKLGQVKDLMLDLPLGRVVYLVVEPAPGLTDPDALFCLPPTLAAADATGAAMVLNTDRAQFVAGPKFQKSYWTDLAFPELAARVRKHYALKAPEKPVAAPEREAVGAARSDDEITRAVVSEIVNTGNGFFKLNIAITTAHGRVTLSGVLKSEKQKKQVVAAAQRVAGEENVEDRLELPGGRARL